MEEIINIELPGFKAKYKVKWFDNINFLGLKNVKQVYGVLFNNDGKILIVNTIGGWQLPGGKPNEGENWEETLIRECLEEGSVKIEKIEPIGYQYVSEIKNKKEQYGFYQLRYFAKIKRLNKPAIDPATKKIPKRKFINPKEFSNYCPWGKIGQYVIEKACKIYYSKHSI